MVNMKHGQLIDLTTNLQSQGTISHVVSLCPSLHLQQYSAEYDSLMAEFPTVTKPCLPPQTVLQTTLTQLVLQSMLELVVFQTVRCIARQEFEDMLEQEIIQFTASGRHLFRWSPRIPQEIGNLVVTIEL